MVATVSPVPLRVVATELGRPAFDALADEVRAAKEGDPLAPCTVLVPSNTLGVSVRRRLASGEAGPVCGDRPGLVGVTFLTVYRLAELLGAPSLAAQGRRPVSTPVVLAAIRRELETNPGYFGPVAGHPATEVALLRTYRELREVTEEHLAALERTSRRASEVVRLARGVRERLADDWFDETDLMDAAARVVTEDPARLAPFGPVLLHLPGELTPSAATLLRCVASAQELVVVHAATGNAHADSPAHRTLGRLGHDPVEGAAGRPLAHRLAHAADADDEVRQAVRILVEALHREPSVPLERMAVLFSTPDPYAPLLHQHLQSAGLRHHGSVGRPLAQSLWGRALLDTLRRSAAEDPVRRDLVFAHLTSVPVRVRRGGDGKLVEAPVARWEATSRDLGIVGGLERWRFAIAREVGRLDARRVDLAEKVAKGLEPESRLHWHDRRTADLGALLAHVESEAVELQGVASAQTWDRMIDACLARLRRIRMPSIDDPDGAAEHRAREQVDRLLDGARGLAELDEPVSAESLLQLVEAELDRPTRRGNVGDGVLVGPIEAAAGLDLDLVVMVGLAEGDLPGTPREDSLLLDSERSAVGDVLAPSTAKLQHRHRAFLSAVAAGREVVLSWPRGDLRRSAVRLPSRWVLDQARRIGAADGVQVASAEALDRLEPRPGWILECPSFDGGLRALPLPCHDQEYRLSAVVRSGHVPVGEPAFTDPLIGRSVEMIRGRTSASLTRFDGLLPAGLVPSPVDVDRPISATRLETWRRCPSAYLVRYVLGVDQLAVPEDRFEIDPAERGSIAHEILEHWLRPQIGKPLAPLEERRRELHRVAQECFREAEERGVTGHPTLWSFEREELLRWLERALVEDDARRAAGLQPVEVEQSFGMRGEPAYDLRLDDGRILSLNGQVDRVDRTPDGSLRVVDYKTSNGRSEVDLPPEDPTLGGTKLQLAIYAMAMVERLDGQVDGSGAEYWFLKDGKHHTLVIDDDVVDRARGSISAIVRLMEQGVFVAMPKEPDTSPWVDCWVCDPDALGTGDAHRRWLHKRDDEAVADLITMVDGSGAEEES